MGAAISPIVQGLMNAYSVGSLIKRQALAERQMKLQEERVASEQAMRDVEMAVRLPQISRPVNSGMVDAETQLDLNENAPAELQQAQQLGLIPESVVAPRKAEASRTIKYNDQQFELLTPEEIAMRDAKIALRRERMLAPDKARNAAALKRMERLGIRSADMDADRANLQAQGVDVPNPAGEGTIRVLPHQVAPIVQAAAAKTRASKTGSATGPAPRIGVGNNYEQGTTTPYVVKLDEQGNPVITTGTPAKGINAPRPRGKGAAASADGEPTAASKLKAKRAEAVKDQELAQIEAQFNSMKLRKDPKATQDWLRTEKQTIQNRFEKKLVDLGFGVQHVEYSQPQKAKAPVKTEAAKEAAPQFQYTATDPKTGNKVGWDGKAWQPVQ